MNNKNNKTDKPCNCRECKNDKECQTYFMSTTCVKKWEKK